MLRSFSLKTKINISIVLTFVVIAAIFSVLLSVFEVQRRASVMQQIQLSLNDLLQQNKEQLGNEVFAGHERAVAVSLNGMMQRPNLLVVNVYDWDGTLFSSTEKQRPPDLTPAEQKRLAKGAIRQEDTWNGQSVFIYTSVIKAYGEDVGFFRVFYSLHSLNQETWHIIAIFSGLLLTFLVLMSGLLNVLLSRLVLNPVYFLKNDMLQVVCAGNNDGCAAGGADTAGETREERAGGIREMILAFDKIYSGFDATFKSKDEIDALAHSFRQMVAALRSSYTELQQAEEKYHSIFENALEGLFQLHPEGRILSANKSMARLWGFSSEQEMTAAIHDFGTQCFVDPDDLQFVLEQVREQGRISGLDIEFKNRDGDRFWGAMAAHKVLGAAGELLYYEGSIVDITERLEKERAQNEREIAEAAAGARREIMDNSGQGFLSFGTDLRVEEEYSLECETIFQDKELAGKAIDALIYPGEERSRKNFAGNLERILEEPKKKRKQLYLSLMPRDFTLDERHVKIAYRLLHGRRMMLILTDVTKQHALENAVELERRRLAYIVSAVKNREDFFDALDLLKELLQDLRGDSGTPVENEEKRLRELYRKIHTAKGIFALLDFVQLPRELHAAESRLARLLDSGNGLADFSGETVAWPIQHAAESDLSMIREALGEEYFEGRGELTIPAEKVQTLVRLADLMLTRYGDSMDPRMEELVRELQRIRYVELSSLLDMYPRLVQQLAERLEKEVRFFQIESPSIRVDPETFGPFARGLVHVFRNAVVHGIEPPDERLEAGKEVAGRISCRLNLQGDRIELEISDDGRGIDLEALQAKARSKGLEIKLDDPMLIVFLDGISSKDDADDLSGRGVGLAAVKSVVDELGGSVTVASERGKGTLIRFIVPNVEIWE